MDKKESSLQTTLRKKISETGISAHSLEKRAGLKRSAVQNILYGKSKKPSAEILGAITKVLGCSIDDILGQQNSDVAQESPLLAQSKSDSQMLDTILYSKAVQIANEIINQRIVNKQDALNFINEIYQYSLNNNKQDIDLDFAKWLAKKCWPQIT